VVSDVLGAPEAFQALRSQDGLLAPPDRRPDVADFLPVDARDPVFVPPFDLPPVLVDAPDLPPRLTGRFARFARPPATPTKQTSITIPRIRNTGSPDVQ
jgi:hypothetical protein